MTVVGALVDDGGALAVGAPGGVRREGGSMVRMLVILRREVFASSLLSSSRSSSSSSSSSFLLRSLVVVLVLEAPVSLMDVSLRAEDSMRDTARTESATASSEAVGSKMMLAPMVMRRSVIGGLVGPVCSRWGLDDVDDVNDDDAFLFVVL